MEKPKPREKIVEVCKVAAPPETSLDSTIPKSLPLTFFDMNWLGLPPVQSLYFYELISTPNTNTEALFHSDILPRLKKSLSLALRHYLPIAGNLTWPESSRVPVISYAEGDAVSLTVAESDADFYRLSGTDELFEATAYHPFVPNLAISSERAAVLALQVTLFPNYAGFSIGISMHHAVLDGKTILLFLNSWAHMCRKLVGISIHNINDHHDSSSCNLPSELKPFYDRTVLMNKVPVNLKATTDVNGPEDRSLLRSGEVEDVPADSVRGTFQLTRANIEKLRQMVINHRADDDRQLHRMSTFSLTCAHTLCCLVKAEELSESDKVVAVFAADCRSRLEAPELATYFGNCLVGFSVVFETKVLLGKDGLSTAAKAIVEAIKSLVETDGALLNEAEKRSSKIRSSLRTARRVYSVAGSPRFEVYSIDFGWGRPRKRDIVSIDRTGAIGLSQSRKEDGVEICLVLKKHHMEAFAFLFHQGLD